MLECVDYGTVREEFKRCGETRTLTFLTDYVVKSGKKIHAGEKYLLTKALALEVDSLEKVNLKADQPDLIENASEDGLKAFYEVFYDAPRLVLCGAGHVASCVSDLAAKLGFRVTVIDDRADFITKERFPLAERRILCETFDDAFWNEIPDSANTFFVLASRSHETDACAAFHVMRRRGIYVGMLGSRKKAAHVKEYLRLAGIGEEKLALLHCPIGLPLGGRNPMEVALSIMAEIVQERYSHPFAVLDPEILEYLEEHAETGTVMATILETSGSTPRPVGSKMLVKMDGTIFGSIGGGITEYAAIKEATESMAFESGKIFLREYDLSADRDGEKGMAGGGRIRVLFERL